MEGEKERLGGWEEREKEREEKTEYWRGGRRLGMCRSSGPSSATTAAHSNDSRLREGERERGREREKEKWRERDMEAYRV